MYSVQFLLRLAKTISVASIALMSLLVVFGNITDYFTNFLIAEHVLKMDTIFPESHIHYRSINSTFSFSCRIYFNYSDGSHDGILQYQGKLAAF